MFALAPRHGDVQERLDAEEIRKRRAALNDQVRIVERKEGFGRGPEAFSLEH